MMVDPEWYYEINLKGKTQEELTTQIHGLKAEINHLKQVVSSPDKYREAWMICPSPAVQLKMHRLYLQKAKEALAVAKATPAPQDR